MYHISLPAMAISPAFDCDKIIADARLVGASRIMLAIDTLSTDSAIMERYYAILQNAIGKIHKAGLEACVWFWALRIMEDEPFVRLTDRLGDKCRRSHRCCPLDEDFLQYMEAFLKRLAGMHPDLILFDDDLTFENYTYESIGCFCKLHRARMEELLDESITDTEQLYRTMFSGKPNKYRSALLKVNGDSLKNYAIRMRQAVDSVDPTVRMGQCGCVTTFDQDGVDSFTISKLLAGSTRPFLRLIGAPYWEKSGLHSNTLIDVIETERLERSWYDGSDIEILTEGDTYPRPRQRVPASYLELFDAALRADGSFDGILKYMMDYYSHAGYERGYIDRHLLDQEDLENIRELFLPLGCAGVRVYEHMRKTENADYTHSLYETDPIRHQLFSRAGRLLSHNSIPTVYKGTGCAGIAFGENARYLPPDVFEKPLILDVPAARILQEAGIDTGITAFGDRFSVLQEQFLAEDAYIFKHGADIPFAFRLTLSKKAEVESLWHCADGTTAPSSFTYKNRQGHRFLILCADCYDWDRDFSVSYARQSQILSFLERNGSVLPAQVTGCPDLYLLCKQDENRLAIGFFNCFADSIQPLTVRLDGSYTSCRCFRCDGAVDGDILRIDKLSAYEWCYVLLER